MAYRWRRESRTIFHYHAIKDAISVSFHKLSYLSFEFKDWTIQLWVVQFLLYSTLQRSNVFITHQKLHFCMKTSKSILCNNNPNKWVICIKRRKYYSKLYYILENVNLSHNLNYCNSCQNVWLYICFIWRLP